MYTAFLMCIFFIPRVELADISFFEFINILFGSLGQCFAFQIGILLNIKAPFRTYKLLNVFFRSSARLFVNLARNLRNGKMRIGNKRLKEDFHSLKVECMLHLKLTVMCVTGKYTDSKYGARPGTMGIPTPRLGVYAPIDILTDPIFLNGMQRFETTRDASQSLPRNIPAPRPHNIPAPRPHYVVPQLQHMHFPMPHYVEQQLQNMHLPMPHMHARMPRRMQQG